MKLALFFSRGVSLKLWLEKGLFDREKLLYEEHLNQHNLEKVYWFTYGSNDAELANKLKQENRLHKYIEVIQMPNFFNIPKIGSYIYSLCLAFLYKDTFQDCDIFKTNQTDGSWSAVLAKKIYAKKLLYRTGFTVSELENNLKRFNPITRNIIGLVEKIAYKNCDRAVVSSQHSLKYVQDRYKINNKKIDVIYNFIDRDKFYDFENKREDKVVFIGRLSEEKNIFNLILALENIKLPLYIYGSGPLKEELEIFISKNAYDVKLMGSIANSKLPDILNSSKYFTLVSKHEGMPKALIEGMACGCICVGTDVSGINEVIVDNNGVLVKDISSLEIEKAFKKALLLSEQQQQNIKLKAKSSIDINFTLQNIVEKEKNIFTELLK